MISKAHDVLGQSAWAQKELNTLDLGIFWIETKKNNGTKQINFMQGLQMKNKATLSSKICLMI